MITIFASLAVGALLIFVLGLIVWKIVRDKAAGKSMCGGNCSACGCRCSHAVETDPIAAEESP